MEMPQDDDLALRADQTIGQFPARLRPRRWAEFLERYRMVLLFVILPTLVTSFYYFVIAAGQYESEARFLVKGTATETTSALSQMLRTSSFGAAESEQYSIDDYLLSHDAVAALQSKMDLAAMFGRPEADWISELWYSHPTDLELLNYYRKKVSVFFDSSTGITTLKVHAYRAEDAYQIAEALLQLGEERVNEFSKRSEEDTIRVASVEVSRAEERVSKAQQALTDYRVQQQSIDPEKSTATVLGVVGNLENELAQTRAQLTGMNSYLAQTSPQYVALTDRIKALESQITDQTSRLTGKNGAMAPILAQYEQLALEREFADRGYDAALVSLETARQEALKQHLFVARVVEPNRPEEAGFPRSFLIVASVFIGLLVAYGIGWLIVAGVKEHAG